MRVIYAEEIVTVVRGMCIDVCCNLPTDVKKAITKAFEKEESELGKYSLHKIIKNFEIAERDVVPICQDTGMVVAFVEMGNEVLIEGSLLDDAINEGVRRGYEEGYLRKSVVLDPVFNRKNTNDNTPAIVHIKMVAGDKLKIKLLPKGAGSENMGSVKMLMPSDGLEGIKNFVVDTVKMAGSNPCPPIIVGVGIGGTMEKCALLSKEALARDVSIRNANEKYAKLEEELLSDINKLGIGPQGFGGRVTALAVNIETYPTHIAMLPVAVNINCHVARHKEVVL